MNDLTSNKELIRKSFTNAYNHCNKLMKQCEDGETLLHKMLEKEAKLYENNEDEDDYEWNIIVNND